MGKDELNSLIGLWDAEIHNVLSLKEPSWQRLQSLLKETYKALTLYHKDELVPKELARIMLCMDELLYFTSLMEEKEKGFGYYRWREIKCLVDAMKKGFFEGKYDYAFPQLKITDPEDNDILFDLEKNSLEAYFVTYQGLISQEP